MKKLILTAGLLAVSMTACKKTGSGSYEVQKPVVGTVTDTVHTPVIETGVDSTKIVTPKIVKDTTTVKVPTITVKKP